MQGKRKLQRLLSIALSLVFAVALLAGCGAGSDGTQGTTAAQDGTAAGTTAAAEKPVVQLSMMQNWVTLDNQEGIANDRIKKYLEDKMKIKLEIICPADSSQYYEKLKLYLSSGDAPDIINDAFDATFVVTAQQEELLYDMGAAVAQKPDAYPTLNKIFNDPLQKFLNDVKFSDPNKNFAIWSMSNIVNPWAGAVVYNGKVLKELNLSQPKTVEEYINLLREIKKGNKDVIPMGARVDKGNLIGILSPVFFRTYGVDPLEITADAGGNYVDTSITDTAKECWKQLQSLYKEGLIDKEILTNESVDKVTDNFTSGKYATFVSNNPGANGNGYSWLFGKFKEINKDAVPGVDMLIDQSPLTGPGGKANVPLGEMDVCGTNTVIYKNSKNVERALEVLNYLMSDEGQLLKWYGVEGIHYTKNADGSINFNKEEFMKEVVIYQPGETVRHEWAPFTDLTAQLYFQIDKAKDLRDAIANSQPLILNSYVEDNDINKYCVPVGTTFAEEAQLQPVYEVLANNFLTEDQRAIKTKVEELKKKWYAAFLVNQKNVDAEWDNFVKEVKAAGLDQLVQIKNDGVKAIKAKYDSAFK